MKGYLGRIGNWFSPRFLAWLRAFMLFFIIYTVFAVLLRYTIAYTIPFIIGLGIAILSQPLIRFTSRRLKLKHSIGVWLSPLITIILLLAVIGSVGFLAVRELIGLLTRIPEINPQAILTAVEEWLVHNKLPFTIPVLDMDYLVSFFADNRDSILKGLTQALSWAGMFAKWAVAIVTSLPTWLMLFIVIFFSAFTFTKNYETLKNYVKSLFSDSAIDSGRRTWADGLQMLGRYVRSYLFIYFLTFLQTFILFLFLGIEYPLIWSALVGVSDLIPILGPGTIYLPMAITRAVAGDWRTAVFMLIGWLVITVVRQFVESKVVADSINIHPLFMVAVLFIAFQAGSVSLMIYLTFLLVLYNLLKHSGMLRPLFSSPDDATSSKKRPRLTRKQQQHTFGHASSTADIPIPPTPLEEFFEAPMSQNAPEPEPMPEPESLQVPESGSIPDPKPIPNPEPERNPTEAIASSLTKDQLQAVRTSAGNTSGKRAKRRTQDL